jgi:hypothetical protein
MKSVSCNLSSEEDVKRPAVRWFVDILLQVIIMSSSSDEEDGIVYKQYRKGRRGGRMFWTHPYIERNIKCRFFVAARIRFQIHCALQNVRSFLSALITDDCPCLDRA